MLNIRDLETAEGRKRLLAQGIALEKAGTLSGATMMAEGMVAGYLFTVIDADPDVAYGEFAALSKTIRLREKAGVPEAA